ncbi:MAG: Hpt domain-containing protein [Zoogloeaceae bacterium]|nr:Hpt domain-containing protein [Zoogloeaceae bacterium]
MDIAAAQATFFEESQELLGQMEDILLAGEAGALDAEAVNALFRAAHTIKGSAGLFGFEAVVGFTHVVESVLDRLRGGAFAADGELTSLLLASGDHTGALVGAAAQAARRTRRCAPAARRWPPGSKPICRRPPGPRWRRFHRPSRRPPWRLPAEGPRRRRRELAPVAALRRRGAAHGHGSPGLHPLPHHPRRHRAPGDAVRGPAAAGGLRSRGLLSRLRAGPE